jgi:uncharacterized protein YndB with AHSA1/START domain
VTDNIRRELFIPKPPSLVWQAIADSAALAEWMYPNNFEPRVGHQFTFEVPPKPEVGFDGLTVNCEVLQCDEPVLLVFTWSAGELVGTQVSFQLQSEGDGTRVFFEHSGFDVSKPFGKRARGGAEFGWTEMLKKLSGIVSDMENDSESSTREIK